MSDAFERLLRWYPAAWRAANGDVLLGILRDHAEHEGRTAPTFRERLSAAANGTALRLDARAALWAAVAALAVIAAAWFLMLFGAALPWIGVLATGAAPALAIVGVIAMIRLRGGLTAPRSLLALAVLICATALAALAQLAGSVLRRLADPPPLLAGLADAGGALFVAAWIVGGVGIGVVLDGMLRRSTLHPPTRVALAVLGGGLLAPLLVLDRVAPVVTGIVAVVVAIAAATALGRTKAVAIRLSAAAASALVVTGCGILIPTPPPTTTVTDASGGAVTISWRDYPAHAGMDGEARIDFSDQAELEPLARDLMTGLATAIAETAGIALDPAEPESGWFADENWYPQQGNGYGGDSMLVTVNCCDLASDSVPARADWLGVLEAASRAAQDAGLGPFVVDDASDGVPSRPWMISATATDGIQWVFLTIEDRALDPTGDALREAKRLDWRTAGIWIGYGATVVQTGKKDAFAAAMQPFLGLERPEATTSD